MHTNKLLLSYFIDIRLYLYIYHLEDDLHSVSNCGEKNMLGEQSNNF